MIPQKLQITLIIAIVIYFILILRFLKNKALELKYTLLWLFAGVIMLLLIIFPQLMTIIIRLFGVQSNMNGLYIAVLSFVIMILMALTSIVSRQANKIKILVQEVAILEKKIRDIQNSISNE